MSIVRDAYNSFSPELADVVGRFLDEPWIDAPVRPGKRGGAFAAPVTPSHHPYVFLNWTGTSRDVATLAHELGHGAHFQLAREQGIFHQSTPLTVAETASVFGETVTSSRLLATLDDPTERFALLASTLEDSIATVFRQVAMNRFEDSCHTARRNDGELSVEQFGELWAQSQHDMLGDSVEVTEGYRSWWSYVPHFMGTPGYVYAYAYGQLLALSVYARYIEEGDAFVPAYLDLLRAGGSRSPEELGKIVGCDLADPDFWANGIKHRGRPTGRSRRSCTGGRPDRLTNGSAQPQSRQDARCVNLLDNQPNRPSENRRWRALVHSFSSFLPFPVSSADLRALLIQHICDDVNANSFDLSYQYIWRARRGASGDAASPLARWPAQVSAGSESCAR